MENIFGSPDTASEPLSSKTLDQFDGNLPDLSLQAGNDTGQQA
jgi:hypothetical protein